MNMQQLCTNAARADANASALAVYYKGWIYFFVVLLAGVSMLTSSTSKVKVALGVMLP